MQILLDPCTNKLKLLFQKELPMESMVIETLKEKVLQRGVTAKIARESGLSHTVIAKIAHGKIKNPGIQTLQKIKRALDAIDPPSPSASAEAADVDNVKMSLKIGSLEISGEVGL
jgi:transcriptional regulator with XRE-family HTH domain